MVAIEMSHKNRDVPQKSRQHDQQKPSVLRPTTSHETHMDNTAPTHPTYQCRRSSDTTYRWLPKRLAKFCEAPKDAAPNVNNSAVIGSEEFDPKHPKTLVDN